MPSRSHHATVSCAVLLASLTFSPLCFAQTAPPENASPGPATEEEPASDKVLELSPFEVRASKDNNYMATNAATGTRIALPIESTPLSISVLTSDFLNDRGNTTLTDAAAAVPGLRRNVNTQASFTLRGFESGVARIDGFPDAGAGATELNTVLIERLEAVKGPTSVLFGFGNPGGVVNLVTKRPEATAKKSLSLEFGSWTRKRGVLDLTGPLVKKGDWELLYRVIVSKLDTLGFRDFETYDADLATGQLQLNYRNTTTLRAGIKYTHVYQHEAWILMPFEPTAGILVLPERSYNSIGPFAHAKSHQYQEFAEFTHRFSKNLSMRAAYTYDDNYSSAIRRIGAQMPANDLTHIVVTGQLADGKNHIDGLQIDLTGSWETPIGKLKTVVGGSRTKTDTRTYILQNAKLPQRLFPIYDIAARNYSLGTLSDYLPNVGQSAINHNLDKVYYALATLETLKDRLTLMAAIGHGDSSTYLANPFNTTVTAGVFKITKPQYGASFKVVEGVHVFANAAESGAINDHFTDTPEQGKSHDIGVKVNFSKVSGSLAYFSTTRSNIQQSLFDGLTGNRFFALSGQEKAEGLEFEMQYFPTSQLQFLVSYAHLNSEVVSDSSIPARVGTDLPNAPKDSTRLWGKYTFKGGALDRFWFGLGLFYNSSLVGNRLPAAYKIRIPGVTRWDAAIGYTQKLPNGHEIYWVLNGENLTDEDYIAYQFVRGTPRALKLSATYRF